MYKLLVWGTGDKAKQFVKNGYNGEIIGFIQTHIEEEYYNGIKVYVPNNLPNNYDYIIVANGHSEQIEKTCIELNIDLNKIIFLYPFRTNKGYDEKKVIADILQEKNYTCYCAEFGDLEGSFFKDDIVKYNRMNKRTNFAIDENQMFPIVYDKYAYAGSVHNYFWQDLWAAKKIIAKKVQNHFDIGSRLDGFIAHLLAANIDVTMIDIREFPEKVDGLKTIVDDATLLSNIQDNSIDSMSALCSLEHFGLGRYGDSIDPEGCFKCFESIQKKLALGADFYLSLPIGRERVEFNAHRVFYPSTVIECFSKLELLEFSCAVNGKIELNADIHKYDNDPHNGDYVYGLFHFRKDVL